jgi:hypothetical protein
MKSCKFFFFFSMQVFFMNRKKSALGLAEIIEEKNTVL